MFNRGFPVRPVWVGGVNVALYNFCPKRNTMRNDYSAIGMALQQELKYNHILSSRGIFCMDVIM